jgi:hypothetical protein
MKLAANSPSSSPVNDDELGSQLLRPSDSDPVAAELENVELGNAPAQARDLPVEPYIARGHETGIFSTVDSESVIDFEDMDFDLSQNISGIEIDWADTALSSIFQGQQIY